MGKIGLSSIFKSYFSTLRDDSSNETSRSDVAVQLVAPALVGIASLPLFLLGIVDCPRFEGFITVVATVSSLLCALALMLFELRRGMGPAFADESGKGEARLIDELFSDVMWCVVVGFAASFLMAVSDAARDSLLVVGLVAGSLALSASLNFVMVVCMCLKRMNAVYMVVSRSWTRKSKLPAGDSAKHDDHCG